MIETEQRRRGFFETEVAVRTMPCLREMKDPLLTAAPVVPAAPVVLGPGGEVSVPVLTPV